MPNVFCKAYYSMFPNKSPPDTGQVSNPTTLPKWTLPDLSVRHLIQIPWIYLSKTLCLLSRGTHLHDVRISPTLMGLIVLSVFKQNFVHVGAGVLEQFISAVEDDEGDLTVAQNAQLVGLLH